ncbi:MAG: hypothetical protein ABIT76_12050 [Chthoniobacterales bacterium]
MEQPIFNISEQIGQNTLHPDFLDSKLWHIEPLPKWSVLDSQVGVQLAIFRSFVSFEVTQQEMDSFSQAKPGCRFSLISPLIVNGQPISNVTTHSPHSITVRTLPNLPLPKYAFEALLRVNEADYPSLEAAIRNAYNNKTLFRGPVNFVLSGKELVSSADIQLDLRKAALDVSNSLHGIPAPYTNSFEAIVGWVDLNLPNIVRPITNIPLPATYRHVIATELAKSVLFETGELEVFDNGIKTMGYGVRQPVELAPEMKMHLVRSQSLTLNQRIF